jgi:hypothetical protein
MEANRFFALLFEMEDEPMPLEPGVYLLYGFCGRFVMLFPPAANLVVLLPPTPTFFLNKKPGKWVEFPYQKFPFELLPFPKEDI